MMRTVQYKNQSYEVSKVVCIGRNYVEHIEELGNEVPSSMVIFNKPNSAISDTLYYFSSFCRFEGEICFLILDGKIKGVGFGLDLTHADIQDKLKSKGLPWERAKGFDNSAVLSAFVPISEDMGSLEMKLYVNNQLVQFGSYDLMMYKPHTMLAEIQSFMTLEDYDIIMSGTPKGVGTYAIGDKFMGQIFWKGELLLEKEWIAEKQS
jgi:2-keto-4-pentenoate hydratase/2-oxohepta-3-ene-1,7-dioic acid hydratase in catechol pathway